MVCIPKACAYLKIHLEHIRKHVSDKCLTTLLESLDSPFELVAVKVGLLAQLSRVGMLVRIPLLSPLCGGTESNTI